MKKLFIVIIAALAMAACSEQKPEFIVNAKGVAPVLLGLPVKRIPASSDKLYDSFKTEVIEDEFEGNYTILHFTQSGKPVMDAIMQGDVIGSIEIFSPAIASPEGIRPGSKARELFDKGGAANMRNDGQLIIMLGDLHFKVSGHKNKGTGLNSAGEMKLQSAYRIGKNPLLTPEDFDDKARIKSIVIY
jgi:hypothetical protein